MTNMKVVEIQVRVMDADEDDKWQEDSNYEPERICITFEDEDSCYNGNLADAAYQEADELKACIERLINS